MSRETDKAVAAGRGREEKVEEKREREKRV